MIVVRVTGGLGNQMFQFASGFALAKSKEVGLGLDIGYYQTQNLRKYELSCFQMSPTILSQWKLFAQYPHIRTPLIRKLSRKYYFSLPENKRTFYTEKSFKFDPQLSRAPDNAYLWGYWQSPKYFENERARLLRLFEFKKPPSSENKGLLDKIESTTSVSFHVRRGDYVSSAAANSFHGLCSISYYQSAYSHLKKRCKDLEIFVFSDDPSWVSENLKFDSPTTYVSNNQGDLAYEDLRLMKACKHNVIANSSFSWWGAWLNEYSEKMVIAPRRWFSDPSIPTQDLIPHQWIQLD